MVGPAIFLLVFFTVAVTVAGVAVALRARTQQNRWTGWQQMAAARGLRADNGDPMGIGPALSGTNTQRSVQRTLAGTVDGIPVAAVMTVGLTGGPRQLHARSDLYGVARLGAPAPVDRIRAALQDQPGVRREGWGCRRFRV